MSFLSTEIAIFTDIQTIANAAQAANVQADATTIGNALASGGISVPFYGIYQAAVLKEAGNVSNAAGAVIDILTTLQKAFAPKTS